MEGGSLDGPELDFEQAVQSALDSLPRELRGSMSNVESSSEEPPRGMPLLGLYRGFRYRRGAFYGAVLPDKITIYAARWNSWRADEERLRQEIRRVVLHEIAHHFGISDERLVEIDRY